MQNEENKKKLPPLIPIDPQNAGMGQIILHLHLCLLHVFAQYPDFNPIIDGEQRKYDKLLKRLHTYGNVTWGIFGAATDAIKNQAEILSQSEQLMEMIKSECRDRKLKKELFSTLLLLLNKIAMHSWTPSELKKTANNLITNFQDFESPVIQVSEEEVKNAVVSSPQNADQPQGIPTPAAQYERPSQSSQPPQEVKHDYLDNASVIPSPFSWEIMTSEQERIQERLDDLANLSNILNDLLEKRRQVVDDNRTRNLGGIFKHTGKQKQSALEQIKLINKVSDLIRHHDPTNEVTIEMREAIYALRQGIKKYSSFNDYQNLKELKKILKKFQINANDVRPAPPPSFRNSDFK